MRTSDVLLVVFSGRASFQGSLSLLAPCDPCATVRSYLAVAQAAVSKTTSQLVVSSSVAGSAARPPLPVRTVSARTLRTPSVRVGPNRVPAPPPIIHPCLPPLAEHRELLLPDSASTQFMLSLLREGEIFLWHSVTKTTRKTYATGLKRWREFVVLFGTDPQMSVIPAAWSHDPSTGGLQSPFSWREACVVGFLTWLRSADCPAVSPHTAFVYLAGVRHFWLQRGMDVGFLKSSVILRSVKEGMLKLWRATEGRTEDDRKRLPVSVDMIDGFRRAQLHTDANLSDLALYTAMIFGFATLSRVSEYLPSSTAENHAILADHVIFVVEMNMQSSWVPSHNVGGLQEGQVTGCVLTFRDAKNDQSGEGHRYHFPRTNASFLNLYDLTEVLFRYSVKCRPAKGHPFFPSLSAASLNSALKAMAAQFNFNVARVSSHSLRIGGASALAAAGLPDYVIKSMGRWKSDAFLGYIRSTSASFLTARDALNNARIFSVDHIRSIHPGL